MPVKPVIAGSPYHPHRRRDAASELCPAHPPVWRWVLSLTRLTVASSRVPKPLFFLRLHLASRSGPRSWAQDGTTSFDLLWQQYNAQSVSRAFRYAFETQPVGSRGRSTEASGLLPGNSVSQGLRSRPMTGVGLWPYASPADRGTGVGAAQDVSIDHNPGQLDANPHRTAALSSTPRRQLPDQEAPNGDDILPLVPIPHPTGRDPAASRETYPAPLRRLCGAAALSSTPSSHCNEIQRPFLPTACCGASWRFLGSRAHSLPTSRSPAPLSPPFPPHPPSPMLYPSRFPRHVTRLACFASCLCALGLPPV